MSVPDTPVFSLISPPYPLWADSPLIALKQTYAYLETSLLFKLKKLPTKRKEPIQDGL